MVHITLMGIIVVRVTDPQFWGSCRPQGKQRKRRSVVRGQQLGDVHHLGSILAEEKGNL